MIKTDLIQAVLELKRLGKSNSETAKSINITKARVEYILKKQGYICPNRIDEIEKQDNLIVSFIEQGKTYKAVAVEMGLSLPLIHSRIIKLKKLGRLDNSLGQSKLDWTLIDEKIITFRSQGLGSSDIAKKLNISAKSICKRIAKLGLPKTVKGKRCYQPSDEEKQKDILLSRLISEGRTAKEIAIEFEVSTVSIHNRRKRLGLEFPKTIRLTQERQERDLLWREYGQNRNIDLGEISLVTIPNVPGARVVSS
jgi:transposase